MWSVEGLHSRADVVVNSSLEVLLSQADACSWSTMEEFFTKMESVWCYVQETVSGKGS